mmetsp:Transcript_7248/g.30080  ORF Transcript_7248/g.30080 Transcript_7248/m.30080 type:complete len:270 (+) Transcript_7248:307-1116(+)
MCALLRDRARWWYGLPLLRYPQAKIAARLREMGYRCPPAVDAAPRYELPRSVDPAHVPLVLETLWRTFGGVSLADDSYGHVEFWDRKLGDRACWASNGTDVLWIDGPRFIRPRPVGRDGSGGGGFVELALDKLHKDDISGGPPLGVVVHHDPPLDPLFCEQHKYEEAQKRADKSEYDANLLAYFMKDCSEEVARRIVKDDWDKWEPPLTLINYLRKSVLEAGGFPGLKDSKYISKSLIEAGIFSGMNLSGDWEDFEPHRLELIADLEPF